MTQTFEIGGMTCGHCMKRVQDALLAVPGLKVEQVRVGSAKVTFDETSTETSRIVQAIEDAGYGVLQVR